jgi:hypothetical protein
MPDTITLYRDYDGTVGQLLTIGEANCFKFIDWPDYPGRYGLSSEHIPVLIRMARDLDLYLGDWEGPEIWAPVHAWRALAQLRAVEAIEPLLEFARLDLDDDAVAQEFSTVFGMIGPAAIAPITAFLSDRTLPWMAASIASDGLNEIVKRYPECRHECIGVLTKALAHAADTDPTANGFAISSLLHLKAVEAIDTIREAFRLDVVDLSIAGDLEDAEIDLGLRERRTSPRPHLWFGSERLPSTNSRSNPLFGDTDDLPRYRKIGRNEPCPCGSGKKYKKCCLE